MQAALKHKERLHQRIEKDEEYNTLNMSNAQEMKTSCEKGVEELTQQLAQYSSQMFASFAELRNRFTSSLSAREQV